MEVTKNYVGKIIKLYYTYNGNEHCKTGMVTRQVANKTGLGISMILLSGQEWSPNLNYDSILKITSAHVNENLRTALKDYCKAKTAQKAFLDNFWKEKLVHENAVSKALENIREYSEEISMDYFMHSAEELFRERFPATGGAYDRKYFCCTSVSAREFTMSHIQDVEKYASPERYPFLYREYDNNIFINPSAPGFKSFCEKNAPPAIPFLAAHAKTSVYATIGDKNWLTASREYTFPLKFGLTKQSLRHIENILAGRDVKHDSLTSKIKNAAAKSEEHLSKKTSKEKKTQIER